jgi:outer membrane protein
MKLIILATLLATALSSNALADSKSESKWGLGIGAMVSDKGYVGVGNESQIIPIIFYQSEDFFLLGPTFGYKLASFDDIKINLLGQYRLGGYAEDDGDIFTGMEDRSGALELGFSVDYQAVWGDLSFQLLADATSDHEGHEISLTYSKSYNFHQCSSFLHTCGINLATKASITDTSDLPVIIAF